MPHQPLLVGYTTERDLGTAANALGISGAAPGDVDGEVADVTKAVNDSGGVAGRPIRLYNHDFNSAQYEQDISGQQEAACTDFAQDHHVAAVVDIPGLGGQLLATCLAKYGIPEITEAYGALELGATDYARNVFSASLMSVDRYVPQIPADLKAAGFFGGWNTTTGQPGNAPVKTGIMFFSDSEPAHYGQLYLKALQAAGYPVAPADVVTYTENLNDEASATSNAVLKFRADGVTHVFNANILFYKDAASQNYFPRYGIDDALATPQLLTTQVSSQQLNGSAGVGYLPVEEANNPPDTTSATTACRRLMQRDGETTSSQFELMYQLEVCDDFLLIARLGGLSGGSLTLTALDAAAAKLGTGFVPALTYRSSFGSGEHDGAQTVRTFRYTTACGCFTFTR